MERTGILHVNPSAELLPKHEDSIKRTLGITEGIYDIFGKHYGNKLKESEARLKGTEADKAQRTLDSDVTSINARNNADTQYYPQIQAAKLGNEQAKIKEVMARTGLSYAQAKVAYAHLPLLQAQTNKENRSERGEGTKQAQIFQAYRNAKPGSEEQQYYYSLLRKEMGGFASQGGAVPGNPMGGQVPGGAGQFQKDERFGSKRSGAGGTYIDPETGQEISTPTNSTTTRNQSSIQALQRVVPLIKDLSKNMSQFQTAGEKAKLGLQTAGNLLGGNYDLPNQSAQGEQDLALAPESLLKAYQLNVTDKSLDTMKDAIKPRRGETSKGYQERLGRTLETLKSNEEEAKKVQAEGIDVTQPGAQSSRQELAGGFGSAGYLSPRQEVAQGFNGNPDVVSPQIQQQQTPAQTQEEQNMYYDNMAEQAIKAGADPEKVRQKLAELRGKR